jgi:hypothetical protein
VAVTLRWPKRSEPEQIQAADVLVITHQAYVNASHSLKGHRDASWECLLSWRGGSRLLTIIDEALANAIESSKVTTTNLSQVIGYIPVDVRRQCAQQVAMLEQLHRVNSLVDRQEDRDTAACIVWQEHDAPASDMGPLRKAMRSLPYDRLVMNSDSQPSRLRIARQVDSVLQNAEAIVDQFAYYAQVGKEHSINSAALLIPLGIPGPVVLDATARANFLWDLFQDRAATIPVPPHVPSYCNVTLHVARATGLGRQHDQEHEQAVPAPTGGTGGRAWA